MWVGRDAPGGHREESSALEVQCFGMECVSFQDSLQMLLALLFFRGPLLPLKPHEDKSLSLEREVFQHKLEICLLVHHPKCCTLAPPVSAFLGSGLKASPVSPEGPVLSQFLGSGFPLSPSVPCPLFSIFQGDFWNFWSLSSSHSYFSAVVLYFLPSVHMSCLAFSFIYLFNLFIFNIYLFIYSVAPGLS